jgi:hypothetical protein
VKVEGKEVAGVFVGRERGECWVVLRWGRGDQPVGALDCVELSRLSE